MIFIPFKNIIFLIQVWCLIFYLRHDIGHGQIVILTKEWGVARQKDKRQDTNGPLVSSFQILRL